MYSRVAEVKAAMVLEVAADEKGDRGSGVMMAAGDSFSPFHVCVGSSGSVCLCCCGCIMRVHRGVLITW